MAETLPPWRVVALGLLAASYAAMTLLIRRGVLANVRTNRRFIAWLRLRTGIPGVASDAAWSESSAIYYTRMAALASTFYFPIVAIAEGLPLASQRAFVVQTAFIAYFHNAEGSTYVHVVNGIAVLHAITSLTVFRAPPPEGVYLRLLFFRSVQTLLQLEQLDVVFIQFAIQSLVIVGMRVEFGLYPLTPPMLLIVLVTLPVSLLCIRGVAVKAIASSHQAWKVFSLPCLPLLIMFPAFFSPVAERRHKLFLTLAAFLLAGALAVIKVSPWIDRTGALTMSVFTAGNKEAQVGKLAALRRWAWLVFYIFSIQLGARAVLAPAWTQAVFLGSLAAHATGVAYVWRQKSRCVAEALIALAAVLSLMREEESSIVYLTWVTSWTFFASMVLQSQEDTRGVVVIECNTEDFISHRLKQKYVVISTALLQAMESAKEISPESEPEAMERLPEVMHILQRSLVEALFGHDLCHLSTVARRIGAGSYAGSLRAASLSQVVVAWRARLPLDISVSTTDADDMDLRADWELIWILVARLSSLRNSAWCSVTLSRGPDVNGVPAVDVRLDRDKTIEVDKVARVVMEHLHASVLGDDVVRIPMALASTTAVDKEVSEYAERLPPGLSFAVLDDSLLSRKFLERFVQRHFRPRSVVLMGATADEALAFAGHLVEHQPDVAVFDQMLEYDEMMFGSDVAEDARKRGFKGCAVMYTANEQAIEQFVNKGVYDGGFSKSLASKSDLVARAFTRAWRKYSQRMQADTSSSQSGSGSDAVKRSQPTYSSL